MLCGNFAIGCGVMVTAGALEDLVQSLQVSVARGGQLIGVAALVMGLGSPLLVGLLSGRDRRALLVLALLWYALGHVLCAISTDFAALLALRCLTMLGAAAFTPQAVSAISALTPPGQRAQAITFVFLGWSLASVLGMPLSAYIGQTWGWQAAFAAVAVLSLAAAAGVWSALPGGIRPGAMSLADWRSIFTQPLLLAVVLVTLFSSAGQFTLLSYFAPYFVRVLGMSATQVSLLFLWFGALGLVGNLWLTRAIHRIGAARSVAWALAAIALSLLAWPLAAGVTSAFVVLAPWALGCFASNSAQQARLALASPPLATALVSLNSSAMYFGQFAGSGSGGILIAGTGYGALNWAALGWLTAALLLSAWAARRMGHQRHG